MYSRSFPPIARADARIVILGTLPGQKSLQEQQYYAHPQNKFWPIMGELTGAYPHLAYAERLAKLIKSKIALWDVCAAARRPGSLDSDISEEEPNDFAAFFKAHPHISRILFNGQPAAKIFKRKVMPVLPVELPQIILPSTSPAHAGMKLAEKLARWRAAVNAEMITG